MINLKKGLLLLGAAAAIGIGGYGGYHGYKSNWFQEIICKNEVASGGTRIMRDEYSCEAHIEMDSTVSDVVVSTERGTIMYTSNNELPFIFPAHPDAQGEPMLRPLSRRIMYDLRGCEGPLIVSSINPTSSSGNALDGVILAMDIPDFCMPDE